MIDIVTCKTIMLKIPIEWKSASIGFYQNEVSSEIL